MHPDINKFLIKKPINGNIIKIKNFFEKKIGLTRKIKSAA
jgi:hypothetical protein